MFLKLYIQGAQKNYSSVVTGCPLHCGSFKFTFTQIRHLEVDEIRNYKIKSINCVNKDFFACTPQSTIITYQVIKSNSL